MNKKQIVQTDLFKAKSESGKVYEISEQTTQIKTIFMDNTDTGWMNGSKSYLVRSGGLANKISDTEFEIVTAGEIATRL